jgi:hypothetical protein
MKSLILEYGRATLHTYPSPGPSLDRTPQLSIVQNVDLRSRARWWWWGHIRRELRKHGILYVMCGGKNQQHMYILIAATCMICMHVQRKTYGQSRFICKKKEMYYWRCCCFGVCIYIYIYIILSFLAEIIYCGGKTIHDTCSSCMQTSIVLPQSFP